VEKTVEIHALCIAHLHPDPVLKLFARGETSKSIDFAGYSSTHARQADVTLASREAKVSEILPFSSAQPRGGR
jgi:hypothetical protein